MGETAATLDSELACAIPSPAKRTRSAAAIVAGALGVPAGPVLSCSCLTDSERKEYKELLKDLNWGQGTSGWENLHLSASVTTLVCHEAQRDSEGWWASRSAKYLRCIVEKIPVVNLQWLRDCKETGRLLAQDGYAPSGDAKTREVVPELFGQGANPFDRLRRSPPGSALFRGYVLILCINENGEEPGQPRRRIAAASSGGRDDPHQHACRAGG